MSRVFYYVYCQGLLGVKTNKKDFKWVYGSLAPEASFEEYDACLVKFEINFQKEKQLPNITECDTKFQAFAWTSKDSVLSYRRTFPFKIGVGYNLKISGNTVYANIGENYDKIVKNRIMNLHGVYYLLSDLANVLLLKNGFLTLYASSVFSPAMEKCIVNFAPPNTGKTITATKLCETSECSLVGEDVLITDGAKVYACQWTNSYRTGKNKFDTAGASFRSSYKMKREIPIQETRKCYVTDVAVLSFGEPNIGTDRDFIAKQVRILNGYLFHYFSSPIVKVLSYFDENYDMPWNEWADKILTNMLNNVSAYAIRAKNSHEFASLVKEHILGEKI